MHSIFLYSGYYAQTKVRRNKVPFRSNTTVRGRRRGRPPLHSSVNFLTQRRRQLLMRTQTSPPANISEDSKDSVDMKPTPLRSKPYDPRNACPTLASLSHNRLPAASPPSSTEEKKEGDSKSPILSPRPQEEEEREEEEEEDEEVVPVVKKKLRIPCEHCGVVFRKKLALLSHMRSRHKLLKKCPICKQVIKLKDKFGMRAHIEEEHKNEKIHKCDQCDEGYPLLSQLKNHIRDAHESSGEEEEESSEEEEQEEDAEGVYYEN